MRNQKGINLIAVIIGVVIGLIIVGIGGFLMLSDNDKPIEPPIENIEPVEENIEVSAIEKQLIKDEYLGYFASVALAAEEPMIDEASIMAGVAITRMWANMEEEYADDAFNSDVLNNLINNNTNTIQNTVLPDNTANTLTNSLNNTTVDTSLLPKFPDGTTVISRQTDIQNAIFETFGQKLDNLSQILEASWSTGSDEDYNTTVLTLADVIKSNGIYTAVYTVCTPTEEEATNGTNLYGLPTYTIEAKFKLNETPTYSDYQLITIDVVETKNPMAYHLTYIDGKYGVIDNNGIVILEAKYSKVVIPNSYIGLFVCYSEGVETPIILNERGIQQFKDYSSAVLLEATAGTESSWTEQGVVLVSSNGYYGLVDFRGNVIYDLEYKAITPLGYQREKIVLTKDDGTQALADINGNVISDFAYIKIGILGIDFEPSVLVTATRTQDEVISMMEKNDYTIGQNAIGTYTVLETQDANAIPVVMSTLAREYQMQVGTWQLALLDGVLPVYTPIVNQ